MLVDTAEVNNPQNLEVHKSGLELWRLLKYNLDSASALNVISICESIRNMQATTNFQEVTLKVNALESRHQDCDRQTVGSKEPEFVKMKTHRISGLPEVFKNAHLVKVFSWRDSQGGEEEHEHRLRDAATPMEVDTQKI